MLRAKASELSTRTLFLAPVGFSWVKLCSSADSWRRNSALSRLRLLQPPAPVPLDSARLPMALQAVRARARPRAESQHLADSVHLADGGCGVQGKYR